MTVGNESFALTCMAKINGPFRIYYEPKSIAEIKLDFYPKLGYFKEVNILIALNGNM